MSLKKLAVCMGLSVIGSMAMAAPSNLPQLEVSPSEVPAKVLREYNAAQESLDAYKTKLMNQIQSENAKSPPDYNKIYQYTCVQLRGVLENSDSNNKALLGYLKNHSTITQLKRVMDYNQKLYQQGLVNCEQLRKTIQLVQQRP